MSNALMKIGAEGKIRLVVGKDGCESPRIDTGVFSNIFTRIGLNAILGGSPVASAHVAVRPVVGSGNSTPTIEDTTLQSFVAGAASNAAEFTTTRITAAAPYGVKYTMRWRFPAGAAEGNLSEVGLANSSSTPNASTQLVSRALIKDSSGDPTTITVLSDEFLDIIYEITLTTGGFTSGTFQQTLDGVIVTTDYTIGPSNMLSDTQSGWTSCAAYGFPSVRPQTSASTNSTAAYVTDVLGSATSLPSGTAYRFTTSSAAPINQALAYVDLTYNASLNDANIDIGSITMGMGMCAFKMSMSPKVSKTNTKIYNFTVRVSVSNAS